MQIRRIRRIRPEEHLAAGAVCLAAYEPFFGGAEDFYRERVRDVARRDVEAQVLVAVDGSEVLGCVTYCPPGSAWREIGRDDEGEFRMLSVAPTAQGHGIGTALARTCEEQARSHGAVAMALSSLPVMTAAHAVYRRLGYARLPERDWSPVPDVHLIAFWKALD